MTGRRIQIAAWQVLVLETPDGPVRLRVYREDPNPYVDVMIDAPPGMKLRIESLPMAERPRRIEREATRRRAGGCVVPAP